MVVAVASVSSMSTTFSAKKVHSSKSSISDVEFTPEGGKFVNGEFINSHGISWFLTGLFLVGDLAGGGVVALPTAMIQLDFYPGIVIMIIMNAIVMTTAYYLGCCWNTLLRCWPAYRSYCRKPYPEIAFRALGTRGRTFVAVCVDITQFGMSVVYLLLSSKNIHDLIRSWSNKDFNFCFLILIVGACILPLLFFKSPQDFWWAVVVAMAMTTIAVVFMVMGSAFDYAECHTHREMPNFRITNYFLGIGTLLFAYGGHSAFPTIQHDMRRPNEFYKAVVFAFGLLFVMYIPVCVIGYLAYGDSLRSSVINSIQTQWIQQLINVLITLLCTLAVVLVSNPLSQDVEDLFNTPQEFGIKRILVRTSIMIGIIFVSLSVPTFGPLMDLMGGTTLGLTSVVLPPLFYVFLNAKEQIMKEEKGSDRELSWREVVQLTDRKTLLLTGLIVVLGVIGGGAATYSAIRELSTTQFNYPCYVQLFKHNTTSSQSDHSTNCCGHFQNITAHSGITCASPTPNFYG